MLPRLHDPSALDPELVGRKAAFLRDAQALGCRVPPGFVVLAGGWDRAALRAGLATLEAEIGAKLADPAAPLVVAVRSSGRRSMPGELETLLGLGATGEAVEALAGRMGDPSRAAMLARDFFRAWRRIVRGVRQPTIAPGRSGQSAFPPPADLGRELADLATAADVPSDPVEALTVAVEAVARIGRERAGEPIAVIVQAMVLGGAAERSGAAVVLSRHALTGVPGPVGEWAPSVAGEALTSGRLASPPPLGAAGPRAAESLEAKLPEAFAEIASWARDLERAHRDAVELEVTIERGVPHLVQVRPARLAPKALVRATVALVEAGVIDRAEALRRVSLEAIRAAGSTSLSEGAGPILATGLPASPGVAVGRAALALEDAMVPGDPRILVRSDASPEDAPAVRAAAAVVTATGGLTSHAAVMSRALGRPCIVSVNGLSIDSRTGAATTPGGPIAAGDWLTVDGAGGRLLSGKHEPRWTADLPEAETLLAWRSASPAGDG